MRRKDQLIKDMRLVDSGSVEMLKKIIECCIDEAHIKGETAEGDERIQVQGEIRGYRKLIRDMSREIKEKND
jgi:hypothetical protein